MAVTGKKRENVDFSKKVGLFEGQVICVNPSVEEYEEVLGIQLSEDSKATEYLGEKEGVNMVRISIWLKDVKTEDKYAMQFFLKDEFRSNKDRDKDQYINNVGVCSWAQDSESLPSWFAERPYRKARVGEEELYEFLRSWLKLNYKDADTTLELSWKKLIKGDVSEIREQIDGEFDGNVVVMATVVVKETDDGIKEYQGIYNKAFLDPVYLKYFRNVDYTNDEVVSKLRKRKPKDLKPYERFILNITGEYGCKDIFRLKEVSDYNPDDFLVAKGDVIQNDDASY